MINAFKEWFAVAVALPYLALIGYKAGGVILSAPFIALLVWYVVAKMSER